jgi:hypothetical protein
MSDPNMRLQLIIEAVYRAEKAWSDFKRDAEAAARELDKVTAAGARAGAAMDRAGASGGAAAKPWGRPELAAFRDHVAAAQAEIPALQAKVASLRGALGDVDAAGSTAGKALEHAGHQGTEGMNNVHDATHRAHSMLGSMIQMALIMGAVMGSRNLAAAGYEYNKTLETSQLGIGAIITSMAKVTDSQGRVLQGQEKWNASQQVSVEAQRELQKIAMDTPATFEELVQAYQGILAPALAAKMTFKETLEFTGLMTNSVKAIGLPLQQIVQESRDLAAGTIDQNSQLARSLQITNDDVKKWREKGIVFQEIKKRLEGFVYASKEYAKTLDGALSNFKDIAQRALGDGSKPLFDFIRDELTRLTTDMVNITKDAAGNIVDIQVKPEVVAKIREVAEELKKLIQFMEMTIKWGGKLAEPIIWVAIAVGIGKITTAVKALATAAEAGALARLITSLPALAATLGIYIGKTAMDNISTSREAEQVRQMASTGHEAKRLTATDPDYFKRLNLERFQGPQLEKVRERFPTATAEEIAALIRNGSVRLKDYGLEDRYMNQKDLVMIDVAQVEKTLKRLREPAGSDVTVTGSGKKSPAELKLEEEWRKIYADLERDREKGQWDDATEKKKLDLKNKYDDLRHKDGADKKRLDAEEAKDLQALEQEGWAAWTKEIEDQEKKRVAAREKVRDALRSVDEQIADHALTELDRQLAGQDKFYFESLEKLQDAGMSFEAVVAKEPEIYEAVQKKKLQILNTYLNQKRQAEISLELSKVDYAERDRSISRDTAAGERVRLTRELLGLQTTRLEQLAQEGQTGSEAWNSQAAAIEATRTKLFDLTQLLRERTGTYGQGMVEGFRRFNDESKTFFQQGLDMAKTTADGMEQAFSDGFFDVMQAKFNNLGQYVLNFLQAIQRAIANFLAQQATNALISNIGSWATSLFGAANTGGGSTPSGPSGIGTVYAHTGGLILHGGGLVPRFHFGGLASDEVPAVLLRKERVLSIEQNQLFERFVNKTDKPGGVNVAINIENQTGQPMDAKMGNMRFDGEGYVLGVVLKALNSSPSFRAAVRG